MPTKPANASDRQRAADFQQVSRRIVRWTTNGLATAIVLVAGLAFGRQIMLWWHEGPAADVASPPPLSSLAGGMGSRELEFGSSTAHVTTETIAGERSVAIGALRRLVERKGAIASAPAAPAGPAEARLMAMIAKQIPDAQRRQLRLDEVDSRLPTVVASRAFVDKEPGTSRRIVAVGFAIPSDAGWTLYAFQFAGAVAADSRADELPLPPESRRSISLRQPDGGVLMAFHGDASAMEWEQFFRGALPQRGWQLVAEWKSAAGRCSARYSKSEPNSSSGTADLRSGHAADWLDVQFGSDDRGQLCGTLTITPGSPKQGSTSQTNSADP